MWSEMGHILPVGCNRAAFGAVRSRAERLDRKLTAAPRGRRDSIFDASGQRVHAWEALPNSPRLGARLRDDFEHDRSTSAVRALRLGSRAGSSWAPGSSAGAGFTKSQALHIQGSVRALASKIAAECLAGRSRVLSRALTGISDRALASFGIKTSQFNLLVVICLERGPREICRGLQMEPSTLSRNVERMQRRGWVESAPGSNRRSHFLKITPEGRKMLEKAYPAWRVAQKEIKRRLGGDGTRALKLAAEKFLK
jgi:DNA-binding MarR family transcriptional regulator